MKVLVVYKSRTGNTKRYAEYIARQLHADLCEFSEMTVGKMGQYDVVCYGAGIYAASLNGLKKARAMAQKSEVKNLVLFATGGSPNAMVQDIDACWRNMLPGADFDRIPHFYMQAGIIYEKMCFTHKLMMKMMVSHLRKKKDPTPQETEAVNIMAKSYDIVDFQYAEPLISLVKNMEN